MRTRSFLFWKFIIATLIFSITSYGEVIHFDYTTSSLLDRLDVGSLPDSEFSRGNGGWYGTGSEFKRYYDDRCPSGSGLFGASRLRYVNSDDTGWSEADWAGSNRNALTVDLDSHPRAVNGGVYVTGMGVKGRSDDGRNTDSCNVHAFRVSYKEPNGDWKWVPDTSGPGSIFHEGNRGGGRTSAIFHRFGSRSAGTLSRFKAPVHAARVRIFPMVPNNPCARVELFSGNTLVAAGAGSSGNGVPGAAVSVRSVAVTALGIGSVEGSVEIVDNGCGNVFVEVECHRCVAWATAALADGVTMTYGDAPAAKARRKHFSGPAVAVSLLLRTLRVLVDPTVISAGSSGDPPRVHVRSGYAETPNGHGLFALTCHKGSGTRWRPKKSLFLTLGALLEDDWKQGTIPQGGTGTDYFAVLKAGRVYFDEADAVQLALRSDDWGAAAISRPGMRSGKYEADRSANPADMATVADWTATGMGKPKSSTAIMNVRPGVPYDFFHVMIEDGGGAGMEIKYKTKDALKSFNSAKVFACTYHEESASVEFALPPTSPPQANPVSIVVSAGALPDPFVEGSAPVVLEISLSADPGAPTRLSHEKTDRIGIVPPILTFTPADFATVQTITVTPISTPTRDMTETVPILSQHCSGLGTLGDVTITTAIETLDAHSAVTDVSLSVGSVLVAVTDASLFSPGDEVIIHQTVHPVNYGTAEFAWVKSITGPTGIELEAPGTRFAYESATPTHAAQVVKVHHYRTLTVGFLGVLTTRPWDGHSGGILAFKSTVSVETNSGGKISVSGSGFRGGGCGVCGSGSPGVQGESHCGVGSESVESNCSGGGGGSGKVTVDGSSKALDGGPGGSGGNAMVGGNGEGSRGDEVASGGRACDVASGSASGVAACMGGGGGGGGSNSLYEPFPIGGNGGGIVYAYAPRWGDKVTIDATGAPGVGHPEKSAALSGAGAGGTVVIGGAVLPSSGIDVSGGEGYSSVDDFGGPGSPGRVRILTPGDCLGPAPTAAAAATLPISGPDANLADSDPKVSLQWSGSTGPVALDEGKTHSYAVTLTAPVCGIAGDQALSVNVAVTMTNAAIAGFVAKVEPPQLYFSAQDWSVPHTFTIDVPDDIIAPNPLVNVETRLTGTTARDKEVLTGDLVVTADVSNNDIPDVLVVDPVTFNEIDRHPNWPATFWYQGFGVKVRLATQPTAPVTVSLVHRTYTHPTFGGKTHRINMDGGPYLVIQPQDWEQPLYVDNNVNWPKAHVWNLYDPVHHPEGMSLEADIVCASTDPTYNFVKTKVIGFRNSDKERKDLVDDVKCTYAHTLAGKPTDVTCEFTPTADMPPNFDIHILLESGMKPTYLTGAMFTSGATGLLTVLEEPDPIHYPEDQLTDSLELLIQRRSSVTIPSGTRVEFRLSSLDQLPKIMHSGSKSGVKIWVSFPGVPGIRLFNIRSALVASAAQPSVPAAPRVNRIPVVRFVGDAPSERDVRTGTAVLRFRIEGGDKLRGGGVTWDANNLLDLEKLNDLLNTVKSLDHATAGPLGWNSVVNGKMGVNVFAELSSDEKTLSVALPAFPTYAPLVRERLVFEVPKSLMDVGVIKSLEDLWGTPLVPSPCDMYSSIAYTDCGFTVLRNIYISVIGDLALSATPLPIRIETLATASLALYPTIPAPYPSQPLSGFTIPPGHGHIGLVTEVFISPTVTGEFKLSVEVEPSSPDAGQFVAHEEALLTVKNLLSIVAPPTVTRSLTVPFEVTVATGAPSTVRLLVTVDPPLLPVVAVDEMEPEPAVILVEASMGSLKLMPAKVGTYTIMLVPAPGLRGGKEGHLFTGSNATFQIAERFMFSAPTKVPINQRLVYTISTTDVANLNVSLVLTGGAYFSLPCCDGSSTAHLEMSGVSDAAVAITTTTIGEVTMAARAIGGADMDSYLNATFTMVVSVPAGVDVLPPAVVVTAPLNVSSPSGPLRFPLNAWIGSTSDVTMRLTAAVFSEPSATVAEAVASWKPEGSPGAVDVYPENGVGYGELTADVSLRYNLSHYEPGLALNVSSWNETDRPNGTEIDAGGDVHIVAGSVDVTMQGNFTEARLLLSTLYCGRVELTWDAVDGGDAARVASATTSVMAVLEGQSPQITLEGVTIRDSTAARIAAGQAAASNSSNGAGATGGGNGTANGSGGNGSASGSNATAASTVFEPWTIDVLLPVSDENAIDEAALANSTASTEGEGDGSGDASSSGNATETSTVSFVELEATIEHDMETIQLSPILAERVCHAFVDGVDVIRHPQASFAIGYLEPRVLTIVLVAGDGAGTMQARLTVRRHCKPGTFVSSRGYGYCQPCPKHSITTEVNARECSPCSADAVTTGYTLAEGSSSCVRGCDDIDETIGGPYPLPSLFPVPGGAPLYGIEDTPFPLVGLFDLADNMAYPYSDDLTQSPVLHLSIRIVTGSSVPATFTVDTSAFSTVGKAFFSPTAGAPDTAVTAVEMHAPAPVLKAILGTPGALVLNPGQEQHGDVQVEFVLSDPPSGVGCRYTRHADTETINIVVRSVNDPPVVSLGAPVDPSVTVTATGPVLTLQIVEDVPFDFGAGAISVSDVDENLEVVTLSLTLECSYCTFTMAPGWDGSGTTGTHQGVVLEAGASGTKKVKFLGKPAALNAFLTDKVTYTPNLNFNGRDTIISVLSDLQIASGDYTGTSQAHIDVTPVNDVHIVSDVDAGSLFGLEDSTLVIEGLVISDVDQGPTDPLPLRVTIEVDHGLLSPGSKAGITDHTTGDPMTTEARKRLDFDAPNLSAANDALRGARFAPPVDFVGGVRLDVSVADLSLGHSSTAMVVSKSFVLTIGNVDDLTLISVPEGVLTLNKVLLGRGMPLGLANVTLADPEAATTPNGFSLSVTTETGQLSLDLGSLGASGVDLSAVKVTQTSVQVTGALAQLNLVLAALVYTNQFGDSVRDTLVVTTNPVGALAKDAVSKRWPILSCAAGWFLDVSAGDELSRVCRMCAPGQYSTRNGETECRSCPVGSAQNEPGSVSCYKCSSGFEAPTVGSTRCTACRPGYFSVLFGGINGTDVSSGSGGGGNNASVVVGADPSAGAGGIVMFAAGDAGNISIPLVPMEGVCTPCPTGTYSEESSSPTCTLCPPGTFNTGPGFEACIPCLAGTASPGGDGRCVSCAPGTFSSKDAASDCQLCPTGKYQPDIGQTKCISCQPDTYADQEGSPTCRPCSDAGKTTNGATGATSELSCECSDGTYGDPGPGPCSDCPTGGVCLPGSVVPQVADGYWRNGSSTAEMFPCIPPHACIGSTGNRTAGCAEGYAEFRCGECLRDPERGLKYYRIGDECKPCPNKTGWSMLLIFVLFLIVVGLLMVFGRAGVKVGTLQIGINFLQMLSLFSGYRLEWPPIVIDMLGFLSVFAFNIEVLHPECEVKMDFFDKTFFILSLPFVFFFIFVAIFSIYVAVDKLRFNREMSGSAFGEDSAEYRDALNRRSTSLRRMFYLCCASLTILLSVLYSTLASRTLGFFDCTLQVNGKYMMDASPTDECFSKRWYKFLWIGIFGLVVYVVMWPVVLAVCVHRARRDSRSRNVVMMVLSPLLSNYRGKYLGWELCLIGRKAAVIMSALFFTETALYQAVGGVITLIFALALHSHAKPFTSAINNLTELVSLIVSALVLLFGLAIYSSDSTETEREHLGIIIVALVTVAILTLLVGACVEVRDAWKTLRRAVDFKKYTNDENVLCLRRVINPSSEGRIRDYLQATFERGEHSVAHERLWGVLNSLSDEVIAYQGRKSAARDQLSGGDSGNDEVQLLSFAKQRVQKHLASTHAVAVFTGGMLQESAAPAVREWLRSRTAALDKGVANQALVNDLLMFVSTFASIEVEHYIANRASKELWHAAMEAEATRRRNRASLESLVRSMENASDAKGNSSGSGDGGNNSVYADEAAVVTKLAAVDRAVTFMLVPVLYGKFGTSWLEALPSVTRVDDELGRRIRPFEGMPALQATLSQLHSAFVAQLGLDTTVTPAQKFIAALPVKYRRSALAEVGEALDESDIDGSSADSEAETAARIASATGNESARRRKKKRGGEDAEEGSDGSDCSNVDGAASDAGLSVFGISLGMPQWMTFSPRESDGKKERESAEDGVV